MDIEKGESNLKSAANVLRKVKKEWTDLEVMRIPQEGEDKPGKSR